MGGVEAFGDVGGHVGCPFGGVAVVADFRAAGLIAFEGRWE
ncbi:hypothetical protein [Mycobacteroides abscessus]|nr:hypothetical protein [Mycobacteroides abscessus]